MDCRIVFWTRVLCLQHADSLLGKRGHAMWNLFACTDPRMRSLNPLPIGQKDAWMDSDTVHSCQNRNFFSFLWITEIKPLEVLIKFSVAQIANTNYHKSELIWIRLNLKFAHNKRIFLGITFSNCTWTENRKHSFPFSCKVSTTRIFG